MTSHYEGPAVGGRVCVLGAGVIGLTTATMLQEQRPDLAVTLLAEKFTVDTLSDGAAGLFRPSATNFCGPDPATTRRWVLDSYDHYAKLLASSDAAEAGAKELPVVILSTEHEAIVRNSILEEILPEYRFLGAAEMRTYPGGPWRHGCEFRTILVENRRYQPYLMRRFEARGGLVQQRHISTLAELAGEFDAVINCTGLGARQLCGDTKLTPIRGQVLKLKAPWIKKSQYADFDTYIIPGFDLVTIGGTRQFDSWNTNIDRHDSNSILERCIAIEPSLKNAEVVREFAGLRPYRPEVRVEKEVLLLPGGGNLKVVHNYGHGGYGVTAAPGTSLHAVKLLTEMLPRSEHYQRSKL